MLVDQYWNQVYSHALAYTKSSLRAQEITQDIFLKLWNKRASLTEVEDLKNFLFILGKHQIISSLRKKLMDTSGTDPVDSPEDILVPDKQLEYKEAYRQIMEAIDKLPPTRKMIFKMSRLEEMTYDEIALKLGISKNTVKEHMVLALSFLRTYMHTHGGLLAFVIFCFVVS